MIDRIFSAGYNGPGEQEMQRWTKAEMSTICDDEGLISLFARYDSNYKDKYAIEDEAWAQIAVYDWLKP